MALSLERHFCTRVCHCAPNREDGAERDEDEGAGKDASPYVKWNVAEMRLPLYPISRVV